MLLPEFYIDPTAEKNRYEEHNNDVNDLRYQKFVSPITTAVFASFPNTALGLDYGCGTGPVAAVQLQEQGYKVNLFDPFFENHPQNLQQQYDFIICCEVMEHFFNPHKEFKLLARLLTPGGKLYCKTSLFTNDQDFGPWYYKNDPTHVFLYSPESLEWIKDNFRFKNLQIEPKLLTFEK